MTRLRSSLILLMLCVGALLASWLQLTRDSARRPLGSSYSYQADGAAALFLWSEALGGSPRRLSDSTWPSDQVPRTLIVLQPETPLVRADRDAFDEVARNGGTLVLAGDSAALQLYARELGVAFEPTRITSSAVAQGDALAVHSRYRLRTGDGSALMSAPNGDVLALRRPYLGGALIVVASPEPFTNSALRDQDMARFVFRNVLAGAHATAFDEVHHSYAPPSAAEPATLQDLLFDTPPGRAVLYAAALTFGFLLLAGRRLGPPLAERSPTEMRRTMYEHVHMLASLYRRAGQFATLRGAFVRHYQRRAASTVLAPERASLLDAALRRVHHARSETELIAAVSAADRAVSAR
jgi:Domain of unknown function (DUF4350)